MPMRPCKHPTCTAYVPSTFATRYCVEHQDEAKLERRERDRHYDKHARNPEARRFYNSRAWKNVRDEVIEAHPVCQRCNRDWSRHVHHRITLAECTREQALDPEFLEATCIPCHNRIEAELEAEAAA